MEIKRLKCEDGIWRKFIVGYDYDVAHPYYECHNCNVRDFVDDPELLRTHVCDIYLGIRTSYTVHFGKGSSIGGFTSFKAARKIARSKGGRVVRVKLVQELIGGVL